MSSERLVVTVAVVADDVQPDEVPLFPTEVHEAVRLTQEDVLALSRGLSSAYPLACQSVEPALRAMGLSAVAARVHAREALVPLVHLFADRALRLSRLRDRHPSLAVPAAPLPPASARVQDVESRAASSAAFNQAVVAAIAPALGIPLAAPRPPPEPRVTPTSGGNRNYDQPALVRARRFAQRALARVAPGHHASLAMGYAQPYLEAAGLYTRGRLAHVGGAVAFAPSLVDADARATRLRPALWQAAHAVRDVLAREARLRDDEAEVAAAAFARLAEALYPTDGFEAAAAHTALAREQLRKVRARSLVFADAGNVEATAFIAAAKELGLPIVAVQQGGHEGYEDDYVQGGEAEYHHADVFVSWGWRHEPHRDHKALRVEPLPTPWLSERRRRWMAIPRAEGERWDALLMPNKVYAYPPAPSGANVSRIDHVQAFAGTLVAFAEAASARGWRVLHKPYNGATRAILARTLARLAALPGHRLYEGQEKGLSPELLSRCELVVWDQPGTGMLECFACGIPTMVLWPRTYNQEAPPARDAFARLEAAGIVHRDASTLVKEMERRVADPTAWDAERAPVIRSFCDAYAWTTDDWPARWRAFLASLQAPPEQAQER